MLWLVNNMTKMAKNFVTELCVMYYYFHVIEIQA